MSTTLTAPAPSWRDDAVVITLGGLGRGVFRPVDYTLLNRRVAQTRLGHACSAHGIPGTLGWAAASLGWRGAMAVTVLVVPWLGRARLDLGWLRRPRGAGVPAHSRSVDVRRLLSRAQGPTGGARARLTRIGADPSQRRRSMPERPAGPRSSQR